MAFPYYPMEYNVIVRPMETETKTKGGVILPDTSKEQNDWAQTEGILVAVSDMAFKNPDRPEGARVPKVGDKVTFARYAGSSGRIEVDGVLHRILKDTDITSIMETQE